MTIYRVPIRFVPDIWASIEPYVSKTCKHHPFLDSADVLKLIEGGHATLFIGTQGGDVIGFCAVEVVTYPSRTVTNVLGVGGRRGFLAVAVNELVEAVTDFGKTQGASVVALSGRPGWLRALRHLGGSSKRFITMWADINGTERRRIKQTDDDERAVETGPAVPHGRSPAGSESLSSNS